MSVKEEEIKLIIEKVLASIVSTKNEEKKLGLFDDMNVAIAKAIEAQEVVKKMSLDFREKIISNIRKKTLENAETFAKMAVERKASSAQNGEPEIVAPASEEINFDEIKDMY